MTPQVAARYGSLVGDLQLAERWRAVPPLVVDALLAAVVGAVTVIAVLVEDRQSGPDLTPLGVVSLVVQIVPLVWRRRAPVAVMVVVLASTVYYGMAELPDPPLMFPALLAFYTVAAYRPRRIVIPIALAICALMPIAIFFGDSTDASDIAVGYVGGITACVLGDSARVQRERAQWLEERRSDAARQAAADERVRIARDLHDVVAHHVSVIAVQAEAAQEIVGSNPARAEQAMADVASTARSALVELRRMLGVLRSDASLAPQPDLAALDELVDTVRRAGLDVTVHEAGPKRPVDATVGLTAYRIVQEALTNVVKHAGASHADVALTYGHGALDVVVSDDGRPARTNGTSTSVDDGQGIIGMQERVAALGGRFEAGPGAAGGFRVHASLPLAP
jgi:signal transduction histidine kinase